MRTAVRVSGDARRLPVLVHQRRGPDTQPHNDVQVIAIAIKHCNTTVTSLPQTQPGRQHATHRTHTLRARAHVSKTRART
jgi:hypothetical protein